MDHVLSDISGESVRDENGRIIIPDELLDDSDPRLTTLKIWVRLAQMLPEGETVLHFTDSDDLADKLNYTTRRSIYQMLRKLEDLGWIRRTKGINHAYKDIEIEILTKKKPPANATANKK